MLPSAAVSMCPPTTGGKGIKFSGRTASLPSRLLFSCSPISHDAIPLSFVKGFQ